MNLQRTLSKMKMQILRFPGLLVILYFQQGFQVNAGIPVWFGYGSMPCFAFALCHGAWTVEVQVYNLGNAVIVVFSNHNAANKLFC